MRLSIIIPYYNTYEYTEKLLEVLIPQLTKEVEVIIIDDGCKEERLDKYESSNIHIRHLLNNSGGASVPRNIGLAGATGEYITFIDSDDMVSNDYIERIFKAMGSDIIFLSWSSDEVSVKMDLHPPKWNCSVWCRVYKREIIGNTRFPEDLKIAEDYVFNQNIKYKTSNVIKKYVYFYNIREGSIMH